MTKQEQYSALVAERKACRLCSGLVNPSAVAGGVLDSEHIGPWSRWQGNLNAELMVVGQEWGDEPYFVRKRGSDGAENRTNRNLAILLESVGVATSPAGVSPDGHVAFFTNAVLCLKSGGLQAPVRDDWFVNCGRYVRAQIELVGPNVVVGLGQRAFDSVLSAFDISPPAFRAAVEDGAGTPLPNGSRAFAVYHCGARGTSTNRSLDDQRRDWQRVRDALR